VVERAEGERRGHAARPVADLKGAQGGCDGSVLKWTTGEELAKFYYRPGKYLSVTDISPLTISIDHNKSLRLPQNKVVKRHPAPA